MKAMSLAAPGGLDRIQMVELDPPSVPGNGEITIRIHANSLNYHDLEVAAAIKSSELAETADARILLGDASGVVTAVGPGVREFSPGDVVVSCIFPQWQDGPPQVSDFSQTPGDGVDGYAREYVTAPATAFTHAPKGFTPAEAATLTSAAVTVWRALMLNGRLKAGDRVLVQGSGGVSIFALQIARAAGATVIATSSSDDKLERMRALGAAHTINYRANPDWGKQAFEWSDNRGVDHVVDVGGGETLANSIEAVRTGGHIAMVGILGGKSATVPVIPILAKQILLQGCLAGSRADQMALVEFVEKVNLRPIIERRFPLASLADAFAYQKAGSHFGKIVIEI